jgi:hypothetical protein
MRSNRTESKNLAVLVLSTFLIMGLISGSSLFAGDTPNLQLAVSHKGCSVGLLEGTYAYAAQGLMLLSDPQPVPQMPTPIGSFSPLAFAGIITFDGEGNFQLMDRISFGSGQFSRTASGTYAVVNPPVSRNECAFTSTFTWNGRPMNTYMVLGENGQKLMVLNTDPGIVLSFEANKK